MGKRRVFTTLPTTVLADTRLSALDLRCLAAIAMRDGMSKVKGTGGGCYARLATLSADVGTDVTCFSRSVSRLCKWGYVSKEPQQGDKRRYTLRVDYDEPDEIVDQSANQLVDEPANQSAEIVDCGDGRNGGSLRDTEDHYSSLREELDSVETDKLNSPKGRHSVFEAFAPPKKDRPEGLAGRWPVLGPHLPANLETLSLGAQVARIEKAFGAINRDPLRMGDHEREQVLATIRDSAECCVGGEQEAVGQQAQRLEEEMMVW